MSKIRNMFAVLVSAVMVMCQMAYAGGKEAVAIHYEEDTSPCIRILNGFDEDVKVLWNAGDSATNSVLVGSTVNTLICNGANDTVAEIAALFEAVTNSAGKKLLTVDYNCSLAADSTDDETLDNSTEVTIKPGQWKDAVLWDTSVCLFFSTYIANSDGAGGQNLRQTIKQIGGNIVGTGNITVNIYESGVEIFEQVIVSPVYVYSATGTTATWGTDEVSPAQLASHAWLKSIDFPVKRGKDYLVRASRATTATTGSIYAIVEPQD